MSLEIRALRPATAEGRAALASLPKERFLTLERSPLVRLAQAFTPLKCSSAALPGVLVTVFACWLLVLDVNAVPAALGVLALVAVLGALLFALERGFGPLAYGLHRLHADRHAEELAAIIEWEAEVPAVRAYRMAVLRTGRPFILADLAAMKALVRDWHEAQMHKDVVANLRPLPRSAQPSS